MTTATMEAFVDSTIPRAAPYAAATSGCAAVIWANNVSNKRLRDDIFAALDNHVGIGETRYPRSGRNYIIVRYDHQQTRAFEILQVVRSFGVDAKIVGC